MNICNIKCAEAAWNYKAGGVVHLKSPAVFFIFKYSILFLYVLRTDSVVISDWSVSY